MANGVRNSGGGFLIVRRINYFEEHPTTGKKVEQRTPAVPWSHDEILTHYKGFEGQPWPEDIGRKNLRLEDGLAPFNRYDVLVAEHARISRIYRCDLIYLQFPDSTVGQPLNVSQLSFCGYDYGYYFSEFNFYSSLFNEVIYGRYEALRNCAKHLNSNLLIPSLEIFATFDRTRKQLLATAADLEADESCVPISIHCSSCK